MQRHKGACHCGRITFDFDGNVDAAIECNCSICRKKGAIWHGTDDAHFRMLSGEADLGFYQFGTMTAKHYFCKACGVSPFSHPRIAPTMWVVNLRCVDDIDLSRLKIHPFDGENWEAAAQRFMRE
ncbi:GFA family protein [Acidiphilium sp. AL]|uniref:GFA family protein n=1 Tax=Acidiphilium sp. AL TaxID=2871704 RepID=UPI0021CB5888|nr:GFA family protein [Acidiphilium sp. AL]MCU4160129.1 GFA family protein [Acidiphilium sp. AL]